MSFVTYTHDESVTDVVTFILYWPAYLENINVTTSDWKCHVEDHEIFVLHFRYPSISYLKLKLFGAWYSL